MDIPCICTLKRLSSARRGEKKVKSEKKLNKRKSKKLLSECTLRGKEGSR